MKNCALIVWLLVICLVGCVGPVSLDSLGGFNRYIGKNYYETEARCPQCFDRRLRGTDQISYLPDGRSFRMGEPNPSAVVYGETITQIEYLRTWLGKCSYILTVRKSDGIITAWRYTTEDRTNCVVW